MSKTGELFEELVRVIAKLRDPNGGCPWDLAQTHDTLKPYLIEESYEVIDAIESPAAQRSAKLREELGDVLLQVVLHAQVANDEKTFCIDDIVKNLTEKLVRRHPHVFGDKKASNPTEAVNNWESVKANDRGKAKSLLDGLPRSLPALLHSHKIGEKVARVGFEWDTPNSVALKVKEELDEFLLELHHDGKSEKCKEELGDLLFTLAQLARKLGYDAEETLRAANDKFTERFQTMETSSSKPLGDLSFEALHELWDKVKAAPSSK
ncbi:MAG: nucleoside triphosphate pyrophosphohydrolase [Oligoflexia bacterium]|nr:nucleoside triphosphate pyrophosphohydrolase [Oligoflexia bacterium]